MTSSQTTSETQATQCGFVALVGAPNVGKSSLLNQLVGAKVSIVSPKVQTTRRRIIGITNQGPAQLLFMDTPGIFSQAGGRLERAMVDAAWTGAADADILLLVVDAQRALDRETRRVIEGLKELRKPMVLAVNKIDLVRPQVLLPLVGEANHLLPLAATFLVSALNQSGCADLLADLSKRLPEGQWLYPEDQLSDLSNRALSAEITREQVFNRLRQELPYSITVETEQWVENEDASEIRIDQTIFVERDSQKRIVIGKGGQELKAIGEGSRLELEKLLEARVHLFLFVKVREKWQEDPERYREMGLDFKR